MNTKTTFKSTTKYLRELSVVVLGVAITFTLNDWVSARNEKKDVQRYLEAIQLELEDNLAIVQEQYKFYDRTGKFAQYLLSNKLEKLSVDSLSKYSSVKGYITYMIYKSSAFEMLKSSGAMRLIKDKELLKSIIDCYKLMETAKSGGDKYMETKWNELYSTFTANGLPSNTDDYDIRELKYRRLFNFFSVHTHGENNFKACEQQIGKTLELF